MPEVVIVDATENVMVVDSSEIIVVYTGMENATLTGGGSGMTWNDAPVDVTMSPSNGYRPSNASSRVLLALPANPAFGTVVEVRGYGLGGWRVTQRIGEQISIEGSQNQTTAGISGYIQSDNTDDRVELIFFSSWQATTYGCSAN